MSSLDKEIWEVPETEKAKRIEAIKYRYHYTGDKPFTEQLITLANARVENFVEENKDDPKIVDLYDKYIKIDEIMDKCAKLHNETMKKLLDQRNNIWNELFELTKGEDNGNNRD